MHGDPQSSVVNGYVRVSRVTSFIFSNRNHAERKGEVLFVMGKCRFKQEGHGLTIALDHLGIQIMFVLRTL